MHARGAQGSVPFYTRVRSNPVSFAFFFKQPAPEISLKEMEKYKEHFIDRKDGFAGSVDPPLHLL